MRDVSDLELKPEMGRKRRDHYIPQGYLKGFVDPARQEKPRPLWFFDVRNNFWSERSPREICYRHGFYDYSASETSETADEDFRDLESTYPRVRECLLESNFEKWQEFLEFLLCFIQMMRARSLLFFEHTQRNGKDLRAFIVNEVSPDGISVKVRSMIPKPLPDYFVRNWTITRMREEIKKGASWLKKFHWCLRYCDSPETPFLISETPLLAVGRSVNAMDIFRDPEALVFFPICWQACLIGSIRRFDRETDRFGEEDMRRTARIYGDAAKLFVVGPSRIDFS
jgi:hypothetical protein